MYQRSIESRTLLACHVQYECIQKQHEITNQDFLPRYPFTYWSFGNNADKLYGISYFLLFSQNLGGWGFYEDIMFNSPVFQGVKLVKQEIDMNDIMLSTLSLA